MAVDRINYIKDKYSVLEYARDVLGLAVQKSGDRCVSLAPDSQNPTAMIVYDDWWYDFKQGKGGDIIDLCAEAKHDGDKGAAIRELAGDYGLNENWKEYTQNLCTKIAYWHSQLRESDWRYLRRRKIRKATADRLMLGYDEKENRLIIPYFKNGYVAYYIGRTRSNDPNVSKYKKAYIDGMNENIPWGLHSFTQDNCKRVENELSAVTEGMSEVTASVTAEGDCVTGEAHSVTVEKSPENGKMRNSADKLQLINKYAVIAEGAFDAMSFEQEGFKVLSPISGYFNKEALRQVICMLKTMPSVFVLFDSDQAGTKFTLKMCMTLFRNRIPFVCGVLPEGYKDTSEYYEAGGDLFDLVDNARPGIPMLAARITDKDEFKKFVYEAARFVDKADITELIENSQQFSSRWLNTVLKEALKMPPEKTIIDEMLKKYTLKYVENVGFYEYSRGGVWTRRTDNFIRSYFVDRLGSWAQGSKLETLLKYLKAETTTEELFNRKPIFNFKNVTLDLESGKALDHNQSDLSSIQMEYDYDVKAECPKWKKFIGEIMDSNEPKMKLLQEMAGYILFTDCSLQKCFILIGDGSNGKSVLLNVLTAVFNEKNISNVEMSSLLEPFQRISLMNSLANITTETNSSVKGAESVFKQIVAGDPINGCFKNKDFVTFKPRCKIITSCNEFMKSRDTTYAFLRRMCFIKFPVIFEGERKDKNLESKLKTELSGIFNWAYEGYKRLKDQQEFTKTDEQSEIMEEFLKVMNPVAAFIKEELATETGKIGTVELYERYVDWAKEAGHEKAGRNKFLQKFRQTVKQLLPYVKEKIVDGYRLFDFDRQLPSKEEIFGE